MKTKEQKRETIDALIKAMPDVTATVFTTFAREGESGLSVAQMQQMRRELRLIQSEYVVAKKRLIEQVISSLGYEGVDISSADGSMGLMLAKGDIYTAVKTLAKFAKTNPALKLFVGWTDGHVITHEELMEMALLPSREELLVRLMGMLQSPMRGLAIVLSQIASQKSSEVPTV